MENNKEIEKIEYLIRKLERGIKVAHRGRLDLGETSVDYDSMIQQYVSDIKELRDKLEKMTEKKYFSSGRWKIITKGRRQPNIPKWPV
tara:strand:- start:298 stop:561 length:264 start_codon:yes stop_codon:yes gene_type:complete